MIFKEKGKRKRKEAKAKHIRISIYHNQTVLQYHSFFYFYDRWKFLDKIRYPHAVYKNLQNYLAGTYMANVYSQRGVLYANKYVFGFFLFFFFLILLFAMITLLQLSTYIYVQMFCESYVINRKVNKAFPLVQN